MFNPIFESTNIQGVFFNVNFQTSSFLKISKFSLKLMKDKIALLIIFYENSQNITREICQLIQRYIHESGLELIQRCIHESGLELLGL